MRYLAILAAFVLMNSGAFAQPPVRVPFPHNGKFNNLLTPVNIGYKGKVTSNGDRPMRPVLTEGERLQKVLEQRLEAVHPLGRKGVIAAVSTPRLSWTGAAGYSDPGASLPASASQSFEIASITKTFTAAAILHLMEKGKLQLSDSIGQFFSGYPNINPTITIKQLLQHRSGLWDYVNDDPEFLSNIYGRAGDGAIDPDLIARSLEPSGNVPPLSHPMYSNTNFLLLGLIVEKVSGVRYAEYLKTNFFEPHGLANISVMGQDPEPGNVMDGWTDTLLHEVPWGGNMSMVPRVRRGTALLGTGGNLAVASDLVKWSTLLYGGTILSPSTIREMTNFDQGFGLGTIAVPWGAEEGFGHSGALPGYNSVMAYFPKDSVAIALFVNSGTGDVLYDNNLNAFAVGLLQELKAQISQAPVIPSIDALWLVDQNENGVFEPGESVKIGLVLQESQSFRSISIPVTATLICNDPDVEIRIANAQDTVYGYGVSMIEPTTELRVRNGLAAGKTVTVSLLLTAPELGVDGGRRFDFPIRIGAGNNGVRLRTNAGRGVYAPLAGQNWPRQAFTVEMMANRRERGTAEFSSLFSMGSSLLIGYDREDHLVVALLSEQGQSASFYSTQPVVRNEWFHLAVSFDGVSTVQAYLNGGPVPLLLVEGVLGRGVLDDGYSRYAVIGNVAAPVNRQQLNFTHGGIVDEVRLWNLVRSREQVQAAMNTRLPGSTPGLLALWNLDAQNRAIDVTEKNRAGFIFGLPDEGSPLNITSVVDAGRADNGLSISPNPSFDLAHVTVKSNQIGQAIEATLFNVAGNIVQSLPGYTQLAEETTILIPVNSIESGVYLLRVRTGSFVQTEVLTISR